MFWTTKLGNVEHCVNNTPGAFSLTRAMNSEFLPIMAKAPSIQMDPIKSLANGNQRTTGSTWSWSKLLWLLFWVDHTIATLPECSFQQHSVQIWEIDCGLKCQLILHADFGRTAYNLADNLCHFVLTHVFNSRVSTASWHPLPAWFQPSPAHRVSLGFLQLFS